MAHGRRHLRDLVLFAALAAMPAAARAQDTTAAPPAADTAGTPVVVDTTAADSTAPDTAAADSAAVDSTAPAPAPDTTAALRPAADSARGLAADTTVVVDEVVAVVGNRPILASQVDEEIFSRQSQGAKLPETPEGILGVRRQVISSIIDEELLVQQALRDTAITVTDQEVADGVEQQIRKVRANFTSEVDYKNELRKAGFQTPEEYRRWLTEQQRRAALQNRLIDKLRTEGKLKTVSPTEPEMKAYFDTQKASLGSRPATVSFRQVVVTPKPSEEARQRSRAQADSIVAELRKGADFAVAARRFSQDPGSRDQGGSLNWFRRGVMVPEFERVAFTLKPGVVSDPVESPFGWHIIQVERAQPAEVQARHILLVPAVDSAHIAAARGIADSVHAQLVRGASFDSLQRLYHDRSAEREAEHVPADKLPEAYAKVMAEADSGTVIPVFTLPGSNGRDQFVVLQVTDRRPAGDIRYEDVKDRIRSQLGQELAIRRYLDKLRKGTYVDVRS